MNIGMIRQLTSIFLLVIVIHGGSCSLQKKCEGKDGVCARHCPDNTCDVDKCCNKRKCCLPTELLLGSGTVHLILNLKTGVSRKVTLSPEIIGTAYHRTKNLVYLSNAYGVSRVTYLNSINNSYTVLPNVKTRFLAIDSVRDHIYFSDYLYGLISRCDLDGSNCIQVLDGLNYPMGIVIDEENRLIYFADEKNNTIGRVDFDGNNYKVLVSAVQPTALAIDKTEGRLYWTEGFTKIKSANTDGTDVQLQFEDNTKPRRLWGIDVDCDNIYVPDYESGELLQISKDPVSEFKIISDNYSVSSAIKVYRRYNI